MAQLIIPTGAAAWDGFPAGVVVQALPRVRVSPNSAPGDTRVKRMKNPA